MVDFILGLALAGMLVRGWLRGFVREALDLVGLILGVWVAFRLSAPLGDFLSSSFGVSPELARIGGGILLFTLFGVMMSVAAHFLSRVMNLPGLTVVNRVGGALVAAAWGSLIVIVLVSLVSVLPFADSWRAQIESSRVAELIAGDDALPRSLFESLAGDDVMSAMASIRQLFGSSRVVAEGNEALEFPPAAADEIRQMRAESEEILERINNHRVGLGLRAVQAIDSLTILAEDHAAERYRAGSLQRLQDCKSTLTQRSYQVVSCDNGVSLAGTALAGYEAILESESGDVMLRAPDFDRAGVAVVDGPTGRLVVIILAG